MRHPRAHAWEAAAGIAAGSAALAALRTATGRPVRSASTLAAAGTSMAAGGLMVYEWLSPRSWLYGPVFWHSRTQQRVVALTFDEGPCHPFTERLLEIPDREEVRATFFQIGNNVRREPNLAAEVASRHVVANHTYDLTRTSSGAGLARSGNSCSVVSKLSTTQRAPSRGCSAYRTAGTDPRSSRAQKNSASGASAGR